MLLFLKFLIISGHGEVKSRNPGVFEKLNPYWSFLWSGFWESEKFLVNRSDLRIHLPFQTLSFRLQVIDKGPPLWEALPEGRTAFSGGIYHKQTGSRILYGRIDEQGLASRLRSPWSKALPFPEQHKTSLGDLQTSLSSSKEPAVYLYLRSPRLGLFRCFGSALLEDLEEIKPGIAAGAEFDITRKTNLRIEGFSTWKTLPARTPSAWFSETPPLPARDFKLYGLSAVYTSPFFGAAGDLAYSDTFAYGRDLYFNAGVRIGNRPWRLSMAGDAAGGRYVGRDGGAPGAGFRLGAKVEHYGRKAGLFRISAAWRGDGLGEPFERSYYSGSYRFPTDFTAFPVKPGELSITAARNASKHEKIEDTFSGGFGAVWGQFHAGFSASGTVLSSAEQPIPFPIPTDPMFSSLTLAGEGSYRLNIFWFKMSLGYRIKKDKDPLWNGAFQTSIQGKPGSITLKAASPDFPSIWTFSLSWRLQKQ
ncbi:MAG: hypothetical protein LBG90_03895 [Spirochaetaceae bacterium]|nr:hypothetical protein [Spirochaetaceae bacterium]